jgi:hypothetical protein
MVKEQLDGGFWIDREAMRAVMSALGKRGGKVSSPEKRKSSRENAKKARAVRMANIGKVVEV